MEKRIIQLFVLAGVQPFEAGILQAASFINDHKEDIITISYTDGIPWLQLADGQTIYIIANTPSVPWTVRTREQALAEGLDSYWPGHICSNGHAYLRRTATGACIKCEEMHQTWRENGVKATLPLFKLTRAEATTYGLSKYWTGKPCVHGHHSPRYTANGICCECNTINLRNSRDRATRGAKKRTMISIPTKYLADVRALLDKLKQEG